MSWLLAIGRKYFKEGPEDTPVAQIWACDRPDFMSLALSWHSCNPRGDFALTPTPTDRDLKLLTKSSFSDPKPPLMLDFAPSIPTPGHTSGDCCERRATLARWESNAALVNASTMRFGLLIVDTG